MRDFLITGSKDTTVIVWDIVLGSSYVSGGSSGGESDGGASSESVLDTIIAVGTAPTNVGSGISDRVVNEKPRHQLYGHDQVTSVAVNGEMDIVVSGSKDGTMILHGLRIGQFVRSYRVCKAGQEVSLVGIIPVVGSVGVGGGPALVAYSYSALTLNVYGINGGLMQKVEISEKINHLYATPDGGWLLLGGSRGVIEVRRTDELAGIVRRVKVRSAVRCLCVVGESVNGAGWGVGGGGRAIVAALEDGGLSVIVPKKKDRDAFFAVKNAFTAKTL